MNLPGAQITDPEKEQVTFTVLAFNRQKVTLQLKYGGIIEHIPMTRERPHLFKAVVTGLGTDLRYKFCLDREGCFPDPYSHFQPEGVHGFSQVIDHRAYRWRDYGWPGVNFERAIIYELHIGTFTKEGTFQAARERLDYLLELGVNLVELMPVTQTPGRWNWGYDGVNLFSVNSNYGTPDDLKLFVDECHAKGLAVILDVVYNHFGPEGNYLSYYGPYFTKKHKTPWGDAVNYDDRFSIISRQMVLDNLCCWLEQYHLDGLRLDAVHAIKDQSSKHILRELADTARKIEERLGRKVAIIAESNENESKIVNPPARGGYGIDAQWMDDFHHCLHTILTGEDNGYYMDYGRFEELPKVFQNYIYTGQYSRFWKKPRGTDASLNPGNQFVVSIQTHDQVGNRARGDRLAALVAFPYLKAAAGLLLIAPYIPMLFMGEEYGEKSPFLFFSDYGDPLLKKAVREGRKKEFAEFNWAGAPDPQDETTFYLSKLTSREVWSNNQRQLFGFYRDMIALRKIHPALQKPDKKNTSVSLDSGKRLVEVSRQKDGRRLVGLFNLGQEKAALSSRGRELLNSEDERYGGRKKEQEILLPGQFILYEE